jgi:hypothetical protein
LYFAAVDLTDTTLNLDPPSLFNVWIGWTIERFNKGKGKFCPLGIR